MPVTPNIPRLVRPPPRPIEVILESTESKVISVNLTVTVANKPSSFSIGMDEIAPTTQRATSHSVDADPNFPVVVFIHQWDPAPVGSEVVVSASGSSDKARVIAAPGT